LSTITSGRNSLSFIEITNIGDTNMKATFTINGNLVEVEGTPQELAEILFGIQEPASSPSKRKRIPKPAAAPESMPQETPQPASFAKVYHEALGMPMKEYIAKDLSISTDAYTIDIMNKCKEKNLPLPPEDRLRKTIEAAKKLVTTPVTPNVQ
jgi:hypothetical protein